MSRSLRCSGWPSWPRPPWRSPAAARRRASRRPDRPAISRGEFEARERRALRGAKAAGDVATVRAIAADREREEREGGADCRRVKAPEPIGELLTVQVDRAPRDREAPGRPLREREAVVPGTAAPNRRGRTVRDGIFMVRFRLRKSDGLIDTRRIDRVRSGGRWGPRPAHYGREGCTLLRFSQKGRPRGDYRVAIRAVSATGRQTRTLTSRKL